MGPGERNSITDVAGLLVGHHHILELDASLGAGAATGATVLRAPGGAVASVDVRGGGPGTRETDLLDPANSVQKLHAVLLAGGSAYGLAAADGVMRWLEAHGEGIPMDDEGHLVPIVAGAVIYDLPVGAWDLRPTAEFGFLAAEKGAADFDIGSVGAGVGARAGVLKGGVGTASVVIDDGIADGVTVGSLVVANPAGSVFDSRTGLPWGTSSDGPDFFGLAPPERQQIIAANGLAPKGSMLNTTIGAVATDAGLSASGCRRLAIAAQDGLARAVRPAHSPLDGDTMFALSTGTFDLRNPLPDVSSAFAKELPIVEAVSAAAALCTERAIVAAVLAATSVAGIPAYRDQLSTAMQ